MGKAWIGYSVSLSNVGQIIANDQGRRGGIDDSLGRVLVLT